MVALSPRESIKIWRPGWYVMIKGEGGLELVISCVNEEVWKIRHWRGRGKP